MGIMDFYNQVGKAAKGTQRYIKHQAPKDFERGRNAKNIWEAIGAKNLLILVGFAILILFYLASK